MNISGFIRGLMSKNLNGEEFLKHVATLIERQLKEWNDQYEVMVMKLVNYEIIIKDGEKDYHVTLSEKELDELQKRGAFAVDRKIWKEVEAQGLPIIRGFGNYIEKVM